MEKNALWDVIVVGGGPAGIMAAGTAAEKGAKVILIEKNSALGKKLLITGGGRCNLTNSEFDTRKLLEKFKENGKFLFSAFSQWSVQETLDFFHVRGMDTKVEDELRTFPVSDSARSVWNVLVEYLRKNNVEVLSNAPVAGIVRAGNVLVGVQLKNRKIIRGRAIIIATGGTSRPDTGSTGDGYAWLKSIGHAIIEPTPSLVPVAIKDAWIRKLAGTSLSPIKITVLQNGQKQGVAKGKVLFTHVGVSGPTILNMSKDIGELLKYGEVTLALDLFSAEDQGALSRRLQELFEKNPRKKARNALGEVVSGTLAPIIVALSGINAEIQCSHVTREGRLKLAALLKRLPLRVKGLLGVEKAIITSGGVALEEVDFRTMRSRLFSNLYLVGDILNIDRPSGGYSLQLCWTTGFVAGASAAERH
jgi:predicted Rossmann fold flavoprotein